MRRILPFILRALRAMIIPRRAALLAELRSSRLIAQMGEQLASHQSERQEWAADIRKAEEHAAFWKVEASEAKKDGDAASLALKLCREELAAAHVQIDATAKIIHALNEQRMMDARIAATRAQGPPSNADVLRGVLD